MRPPLFCVVSAGPSLSCDRQLQGPGRLTRHQPGELVRAAEADRHLGHDLIMHMQHDRIASGLYAQHCFSEQITGDAGHDILGPKSAVSAVAVAAVLKLAGRVVCEDDMLALLVPNRTRLRV